MLEAVKAHSEAAGLREAPSFGQTISVNPDTNRLALNRDGASIALQITPSGRYLLDHLMEHPGEPVTQFSMLARVQRDKKASLAAGLTSRSVPTTMTNLRTNLNELGELIRVERDEKGKVRGYTLCVDGVIQVGSEPASIPPTSAADNVVSLPVRHAMRPIAVSLAGVDADEAPQEGQYRVFSGDMDIFVPVGQEQAYLERHGIKEDVLPNGVKITSGTRLAAEEPDATVKLTFPSASIYEPADKQGMTHVLEHLVTEQPVKSSGVNEAQFSAWTSLREMIFRIRGAAHPGVGEYGVWPVVPVLTDVLTHPLTSSVADLEREKRVVKSELVNGGHGLDDDKMRNGYFVERYLYMPGNPVIGHAAGTPEVVDSLTLADVAARHDNFFIPQGLHVEVIGELFPETTTRLVGQLADSLGAMTDNGKRPPQVPLAITDTLNPGYEQGEMVSKVTDRKDGQQDIYLLWAVPSGHLSTQHIADTNFFHAAWNRMRASFRRSGGYSMRKFPQAVVGEHIIYRSRLRYPTKENPEAFIEEFYPALRADSFASFTDDDLSYMHTVTQRRAAASMVPMKSRFDHVILGRSSYGRIIDADRVQALDSLLTVDSLRASQERFHSMPPTILVDK